VHDGGKDYKVPQGGWVTKAQKDHPDTRTAVIDRDHDWRNQKTDVRHWHDDDCGRDWDRHDHGFYCGDNFWFGFEMGQLAAYDWDQPVYVVSPVTGDPIGPVPPPDDPGQYNDPNAAYEQILNTMAAPAQDQNDPNYDPTAGVYQAYDNFDPTNPGQQINGNDAFSDLSNGQGIYFHPPNGDWEAINSLDDLNAYLYTQESQTSQQPAPTSDPTPADPTSDPTPADPTSDPTPADPTSDPTPADPTSDPTPADPTQAPDGDNTNDPADPPQAQPQPQAPPENWWDKFKHHLGL
jgi:hypothetical protein